MPTIVTNTIGSGGDYSTLALWEAGAPANLVTEDQIWEGQVLNEDLSSATNLLNVTGSTVDSTRYKRLTTASGASFVDNVNVQTNALRANPSNGACITITGNSYANAITVEEDYFRIDKLQVRSTATSGRSGCFYLTGQTECQVDRCIIEGYGSGLAANDEVLYFEGTNCIVKNSLVVQRMPSADFIAGLRGTSSYNCTFVVPTDVTAAAQGVYFGYATGQTFRNNVVLGAINARTGSGGTLTTNFTSDATPPTGFSGVTFNTSLVGNTELATLDMRPVSGSALIDVATTDSTHAATDIAGTSRPSGASYDAGCWEFVSANSEITGTGALTLGSLEASGSGTSATPSSAHTGSGNLDLGAVTSTGGGSRGVLDEPGPIDLFLPAVTLSGSGDAGTTGQGALTLPAIELSGMGERIVNGTGALTLPSVTLSGDGGVSRYGTGALTFPAVTLSASGQVGGRIGSGDLTLPAIQLSAAGAVGRTGSGELTLPAITLQSQAFKNYVAPDAGSSGCPHISISIFIGV